jgi:hypothetical protein
LFSHDRALGGHYDGRSHRRIAPTKRADRQPKRPFVRGDGKRREPTARVVVVDEFTTPLHGDGDHAPLAVGIAVLSPSTLRARRHFVHARRSAGQK